ncbi:MAG: hypothetical protein BWY67_01922 [Bacteroidetes bacterium ADurb.Bin397]|nr:MAG: hypothetical protein BWY67_01922 [Bacteroidetes bacterium ADurb.Bin397]
MKIFETSCEAIGITATAMEESICTCSKLEMEVWKSDNKTDFFSSAPDILKASACRESTLVKDLETGLIFT